MKKAYYWPLLLVAAVGVYAALQFTGKAGACGLGLSSLNGQSQDAAAHVPAPTFKAQALSGGTINFPADFKGKIVLIDFWATWCRPCRAELPNVVRAYDRYHARGFDVVGVTLDGIQRVPATRVESFTADQKMKWQQVYADAADVARSYGVDAIPAAFLVDGDTGTILAAGDATHGDALSATIERYLKK